MKNSLVAIFGFVLASAVVLGVTQNGDKAPLVESGVISKIDLPKKILTVRGNVNSLPEQLPGQRSGNRGNRGAGVPSAIEDLREFKVYVTADTVIQKDKTTLTLMDLRVNDYVMVVGNKKGKSSNVDATSISVSDR